MIGKYYSVGYNREMEWDKDFAYVVGLIATDGNLSPDGRHISLTSKDRKLVLFVKKVLAPRAKIGIKKDRPDSPRRYYVVQWSSREQYQYFCSIGITPKKSLTIKKVNVPEFLYVHFLRGVFDGDGSFYAYYDKRWKNSYQYYTVFSSASKAFIDWLRTSNHRYYGIVGHISRGGRMFQLRYGKGESATLLEKMYHGSRILYLKRKRLKILRSLGIMGRD